MSNVVLRNVNITADRPFGIYNAQGVRLIFEWVQIEDADIGLVQVGSPRCPYVRGDAVLVGEPEQRPGIGDERMMYGPSLLRNLDAIQPLGKTLRDIFLKETLFADAPMVSLHGDWAPADVRQH